MTGAIGDHIATAYKENSSESIYFLMVYNVFNAFLGDVSEGVLPTDRTGHQDTRIWQKLLNFQRDAATGFINKPETYNQVSFTDQHLQHRVSLIVRISQRTATPDCDGQTWRVGFGLLRPLVDI